MKEVVNVKFFILILSLSVRVSLSAQTPAQSLNAREDILKNSFRELYRSSSDRHNDSINTYIAGIFSECLSDPTSFAYPWDSLNMIGRIHSEDKKVNIYTWYSRTQKGIYSYYGYIQYNAGSAKKPDIRLYALSDRTKGMKNPETLVLSPENWLGCVYFNIYTFKYRGGSFYCLLGYNFNNDFSDKKYLELLSFPKEGNPVFGGEFQNELQKVKRVIFEYSAQVVMSIKYDAKLKMIVLDHLAPFEPMLTGSYRFYGPDGSYDAYEFKKGSFILKRDVDARNLQ
jgi:hypothetical protein